VQKEFYYNVIIKVKGGYKTMERCPKCGLPMRPAGIKEDDSKRRIYIYVCPNKLCGTIVNKPK